jgi:hypothetical protein
MPVRAPDGRGQVPPGGNVAQQNGFNPVPPPVPTSSASPAPKATTTGLPPAALPPLDPVPPPAPSATATNPGPGGTKPVAKDEKAELAEMYRAQDQCLSSCDQFACMKIAAAYKKGITVPKDPLAGRRYAMHACLECGAAGPGIADQCPEYQLTPKGSP